jgi:hypothetical protein
MPSRSRGAMGRVPTHDTVSGVKCARAGRARTVSTAGQYIALGTLPRSCVLGPLSTGVLPLLRLVLAMTADRLFPAPGDCLSPAAAGHFATGTDVRRLSPGRVAGRRKRNAAANEHRSAA